MNTQELETKVSALPPIADALKIENDDDYQRANKLLLDVKDFQKEVKADFADSKATTHKAWKTVVAQENGHLEKLLYVEQVLKPRIGVYHAKRERKRQIEEARLQEEADLAEASEAEAEGDTERAEAVLNGGGTTAISLPKVATPSGVSFRENWNAEVTGFRLLVEAWLAGKVPDNVICPDMKVLNASARALKSSLNWPGVKAIKTPSVAAGRR